MLGTGREEKLTCSAANLGLLGGLGYFTYLHWDDPVWDRRYVTGFTAGLIALFAGQGLVIYVLGISHKLTLLHRVIAEQYREKEYPKRR